MSAGSQDTLQCCRRFVSAINPLQLQGSGAREMCPGMQNVRGPREFLRLVVTGDFFCVCDHPGMPLILV